MQEEKQSICQEIVMRAAEQNSEGDMDAFVGIAILRSKEAPRPTPAEPEPTYAPPAPEPDRWDDRHLPAIDPPEPWPDPPDPAPQR